eukprot:1151406-Alexandrium_andersonii.AAC.1
MQRNANRLVQIGGHVALSKSVDPSEWPQHVRGAWCAVRADPKGCETEVAALAQMLERHCMHHRVVLQMKLAASRARKQAVACADQCRAERRKRAKQRLHDKHGGLALAFRIMRGP